MGSHLCFSSAARTTGLMPAGLLPTRFGHLVARLGRCGGSEMLSLLRQWRITRAGVPRHSNHSGTALFCSTDVQAQRFVVTFLKRASIKEHAPGWGMTEGAWYRLWINKPATDQQLGLHRSQAVYSFANCMCGTRHESPTRKVSAQPAQTLTLRQRTGTYETQRYGSTAGIPLLKPFARLDYKSCASGNPTGRAWQGPLTKGLFRNQRLPGVLIPCVTHLGPSPPVPRKFGGLIIVSNRFKSVVPG